MSESLLLSLAAVQLMGISGDGQSQRSTRPISKVEAAIVFTLLAPVTVPMAICYGCICAGCHISDYMDKRLLKKKQKFLTNKLINCGVTPVVNGNDITWHIKGVVHVVNMGSERHVLDIISKHWPAEIVIYVLEKDNTKSDTLETYNEKIDRVIEYAMEYMGQYEIGVTIINMHDGPNRNYDNDVTRVGEFQGIVARAPYTITYGPALSK